MIDAIRQYNAAHNREDENSRERKNPQNPKQTIFYPGNRKKNKRIRV